MLFFGEAHRECSWQVQHGWASELNGHGIANTLVTINWNSCQPDAISGCRHPFSWKAELGFKSLHPQGINILLGDRLLVTWLKISINGPISI